MTQPRNPDIVIDVEPPDEPDGQRLLQRFEQEKLEREDDYDIENAVRLASEELMPPDGAFLLARHEGRAVGCGGIRRLGPDVGELRRLYVAPEARSLGLGRLLFEAMEEAARRIGYRTVRLDTNPALEEARVMFEELGYREIPPYNDNPNAGVWYEKDL
jgi:GNAT superfamily N-acetyltransferase